MSAVCFCFSSEQTCVKIVQFALNKSMRTMRTAMYQPPAPDIVEKLTLPLGDFLCIPIPNTGQLNPLFHTSAEFRLIVNRIVVRQSN